MGKEEDKDPGEAQFSQDFKPTTEQAKAFRDRKIEEGRKNKNRREAQEIQQRQEPVINRMIDEDREDANHDGGPQMSAEEFAARNAWAGRYFSRNEHFGFGHNSKN